MVFIFCGSYLSVPDTMTAVKNEQDDFIIISSSLSIVKLFSELYSPQNVFLLPDTEIVFSKPLSIFKSIMRIQSVKKDTLPLLLKHHPDKVVFFYVGFNGIASWLIKKISRVAKIYYRPGTNPDFFQRSYNIKLWIKSFFYSALYRIYFAQKRHGDYCFNGVSDRFLRVINARNYSASLDMKYVEDVFRQKYPELRGVTILLLVDQEPNVDKTCYDKQMADIIRGLIQIVQPYEIGIKVHPDSTMPDLDIPAGCVMLPQYLAANLLMLNSRVVISYLSGTLFESANIGKKAISLLHILKAVNLQRVDYFKNYLLTNTKGEISFPATIDELVTEVKKGLSCSAKG